jgi:hypothetical protein
MPNSTGFRKRLISRIMKPQVSDEMVDALAGSTPQIALAKGVLTQVKQDLRRFRGAQDAVGREMYRDAFSWVASNDCAWPYSFLNVCEALGLQAEMLREELLAGTEGNWYTRSRRFARKFSTSFRGSLASVFLSRTSVANSRRASEPMPVH